MPRKQNELVENWITRKVDVIAVAVENRGGISTVLRKARERGIQVLTWDCRRGARRARFLRQPGDVRGHRQHADRRGGAAARRQGRVRDHHRRAERREPERVDRVHQEAARRQVPEPEARDDPSERRRPRQGVRRDADDHEGVSGGEAGDGDLGAGGAGRRRSGASGRTHATSTSSACRCRTSTSRTCTTAWCRPSCCGTRATSATSPSTPVRCWRRTGIAPGTPSIDARRLGKIQIRGTEIILGAPMMFTKANIDKFDF